MLSVAKYLAMKAKEVARYFATLSMTGAGIRGLSSYLKSRMCVESCGGIVRGNRIVPEYFGLEVVIAVAMQVDSYEADRFRRHILSRLTASTQPPIYISLNCNSVEA